MAFKKIKFKFVEKKSIRVFLLEHWIRIEKKNAKVPSETNSWLFMNPTAYLTPPEFMFPISNQSVKPFNLQVGEHRDIESQNPTLILLNLEYLLNI